MVVDLPSLLSRGERMEYPTASIESLRLGGDSQNVRMDKARRVSALRPAKAAASV